MLFVAVAVFVVVIVNIADSIIVAVIIFVVLIVWLSRFIYFLVSLHERVSYSSPWTHNWCKLEWLTLYFLLCYTQFVLPWNCKPKVSYLQEHKKWTLAGRQTKACQLSHWWFNLWMPEFYSYKTSYWAREINRKSKQNYKEQSQLQFSWPQYSLLSTKWKHTESVRRSLL